MLVIFHFSSQSNPFPALTERVWDKLLHVMEYGGLALLTCRALVGEGIGRSTALLLALVISSLYGITDEWHEAFVPSRNPDVLDWLSDSIGSALGAAAYLRVTDFRPARERRSPP
jgi:VanZ family protein